jgi:hypothetical protein
MLRSGMLRPQDFPELLELYHLVVSASLSCRAVCQHAPPALVLACLWESRLRVASSVVRKLPEV